MDSFDIFNSKYVFFTSCGLIKKTNAEIILCMRPANERPHYNVTSSLIGWAYTEMIPANENILTASTNR